MKSNELRIGNQIKYHDKIITVAGIVRNTIYYESKELCFDGNIGDYNPFEPIPLTEDWLLKAGFEVVYDSEFTKRLDFIKDNRFDFFINKQNETISGIRFKGNTFFNEVKHVHQLQNLYFALTGNELKIK
jgi:hypothetical protein